VEARALLPDLADNLDEVRQGAPEPVQPPDDQNIIRSERRQCPVEAGPLHRRARGHFETALRDAQAVEITCPQKPSRKGPFLRRYLMRQRQDEINVQKYEAAR
jgi:hypothetical protein